METLSVPFFMMFNVFEKVVEYKKTENFSYKRNCICVTVVVFISSRIF